MITMRKMLAVALAAHIGFVPMLALADGPVTFNSSGGVIHLPGHPGDKFDPAQIPPAASNALGGILGGALPPHHFATGIDPTGALTHAQPAASDVSGLAASATTDATNASNIITGTLGTGRLQNFGAQQSIATQGATCLGVADEYSILTGTGAAAQGVVVPPGCQIRVATNVTIPVPLTIMAGGQIKVDGAALTLSGGFDAPLGKVFTVVNGGSVKFATGVQRAAYPEWWAGIGASDYLAAFSAAQNSGAALVRLQMGDYPISAPWIDHASSVEIAGSSGILGVPATRVLLASSTGNIFTLGSTPVSKNTASDSAWQKVHDITFQRTVQPTCAAQGSEAQGPSGFVASIVQNADVYNVDTVDNCNGFLWTGVTQAHFRNLTAVRTAATSGASYDYFYAFHMASYGSPLTSGGNASLYVEHALAVAGAGVVNSLGFNLVQGTDTYLRDIETGGTVATCGQVLGSGSPYSGGAAGTPTGTPPDTYKSHDEDITLDHIVCDQVAHGLSAVSQNEYGSLGIHHSYVALSAAAGSGDAAYTLISQNGTTSLTDNQGLGWYANDRGSPGAGVLIENSSGVRTGGNRLTGFARPEIVIGSDGFVLDDTISVPSSGEAPSEALVVCVSCQHGKISPLVTGAAGAAGSVAAVSLDANSAHNLVDLSGIKASVVANKFSYNGTAASGAGTYGTDNIAIGPTN